MTHDLWLCIECFNTWNGRHIPRGLKKLLLMEEVSYWLRTKEKRMQTQNSLGTYIKKWVFYCIPWKWCSIFESRDVFMLCGASVNSLIWLIIEKCQEHHVSGWKRAKNLYLIYRVNQSLTAQEKLDHAQVLSVANIWKRASKNKQSKTLLSINPHVLKGDGTCVCVRQRETFSLRSKNIYCSW